MPGFEKHRFVNLNQLEDDFTCGICLQILNNPSVTPCCRQTYCYDCINEWLNNKNSCPNDRQRLIATELYSPQRLVVNLLAKLRIRCDFALNGCQTVVDLECLKTHSNNCPFNPNRNCIDCGLKMSGQSTHYCINSLKLLNTSLAEEIFELKSEIEKLKQEIKSLKEKNVYNNEIVSFFCSFSLC